MSPHYPPTLDRDFDELACIELQIARRADELNRQSGSPEERHNCWLEAEREFWRTWFSHAAAPAA
jgi:hypothetical protein